MAESEPNAVDPNAVFEATVVRAEEDARRDIGRYKRKLLFFALLGYAVIFSVLLALVGLSGGIVATAMFSLPLFLLLLKKKLLFVLIPAIWIMLKALWVKFDPPGGYRLERGRFPALFAELDALHDQLDTPRIHEVVLTPELNAAVAQTPRLGVLGWYRNTLVLGLELLMTLSPEQARAVIGHELGHLSGNHSRFNGWIYRVRISWYRIMEAFHQQASFGAGLMARFFDWYAPRFAAYSFALARINEYEADAVSAELTSPHEAGAALVNTHVTGPWVDEHYWSEYFRTADERPEPAHLPWAGLKGFLSNQAPIEHQLKERLDSAMQAQTEHDDTHPALADRLAALTADAELPPPPERNAAEAWLGEEYEAVLGEFDQDWLEYNGPRWRERYDYVQQGREKLRVMRGEDMAALEDEKLWELARLNHEFGKPEEAIPVYLAYRARYPEDPDVAYGLGMIYYDQGDERLLEEMEKALERPSLVIDACRYAYYFLEERGRHEEKERWRERAEAQAAVDHEAEIERGQIAPGDPIEPITLDVETHRYLLSVLEANGGVGKAWVAQKRMQHYADVPAIAIVVAAKGLFGGNEKVAEAVSEALELDCTFFVIPKGGDYAKLAREIIAVGEQIL